MIYMGQPLKLDYLWAALCLVGAVYSSFALGRHFLRVLVHPIVQSEFGLGILPRLAWRRPLLVTSQEIRSCQLVSLERPEGFLALSSLRGGHDLSLIHRAKASLLDLWRMMGESPDAHPAGHQRDSQQPLPVALGIGGVHAAC